jgi:DMSO/TMAO reductase YedYZ molybdopterin-dependent catalytic subunit
VTGPGITRPARLTYDDLRRLPSVTVTCALECAGNGRGFLGERDGRVAPGAPWALGGIGVAEWTGVRLSEILKRAGVRSRALEVMPIGLDDRAVRRPLPLAKAMEDDTILAYGMNGATLPADHGYPARVVVPGWAGIASIKWVGRIEVSDKPLSSPWNTEQYVLREPGKSGPAPPVAEQVVKSALELPWPATLEVGPNTLRGRSWSGTGAIARVEWSVDGGPWRPARLVPPNLPRAWVRWTLRWDAARGNHEIRVRAMDDQMHVQPESSPWNELGYLNGAILAHPVLVA